MFFKIKIQNTWLKMLLLATIIFSMLFFYSIPAFSNNMQLGDTLSKAEKYFLERKLDSAKILYSLVLEEDPKNVDALIGMAKIEFTQFDYEDKVNRGSGTREFNQQSKDIYAESDLERYNIAYNYLKMIDENKTDNLEYFYFMGILQKEMIKLKITADRNKSCETAKKCFEKIIKKDSGYKDVLLQYALLLNERGEYKNSIDLVKRYIRLKPNYADGYLCLNRIVYYMYEEEGYENAKEIFLDNCDINNYCYALLERKKKNYDEAIELFQGLQKKVEGEIPQVLICKELLKCLTAEKKEDLFIATYNKMMNITSDDKDCDLIFDDVKYLANNQEISKYYTSDYNLRKEKWFPSFWARRSNTGTGIDKRVYEHYKRLLYAENIYYHDRERFSILKPINSYNSNYEFSDQGYIYIKYGEPDKISKSTEVNGAPATLREAWLYNPSANNEKKIFHFFSLSRTLVSINFDSEFLDEIRHWDSRYNSYLAASKQTLATYSKSGVSDSHLADDLRDTLAMEMLANISQERSEVNLTYKQIKLNYEAYKFRGNNNTTELLISYFWPVPTLFKELSGKIEKINAIAGYYFYNNDWDLIAEKSDSVIFIKKRDGLSPKVKFVSLKVDTGIVNCSMFCNPIGTGVSCFNKDNIKIESYPKSKLCSSDLMIAFKDTKEKSIGKKWNNEYLLPSPTNKWSLKKPINLYYEIYNLVKNRDGKTLFRVEYAFRFKGNNENIISKIFSKGNSEVVSAEYSQSGKEGESHQCMSFEVNRLSPGDYTVEITVNDINSGKHIILSKDIQLF